MTAPRAATNHARGCRSLSYALPIISIYLLAERFIRYRWPVVLVEARCVLPLILVNIEHELIHLVAQLERLPGNRMQGVAYTQDTARADDDVGNLPVIEVKH